MKSILLLLVAALSLTACEQEDSGYSYDFPVYDPTTDPTINDYIRKNTPILTIPPEIKDSDLTHQSYSCPDISGTFEYKDADGGFSFMSFKKESDGSLSFADGLGAFAAVDGKTEQDGHIVSCNGGNIVVKVKGKDLSEVYLKIKPSADGNEISVGDRYSLLEPRTYSKNQDIENAEANHSDLECPEFRGDYTGQSSDGSQIIYRFTQSTFGVLTMSLPAISETALTANGTPYGETTRGVLACQDNKLLWVIRDEKQTIQLEMSLVGDDISVTEKLTGQTSILKASPSI